MIELVFRNRQISLDFDLSEVKRMFEMLGVKQLAFV